MPVIDIHPHIISTDTRRYPITPLGGKRSTWSSERPATVEQLVAGMDAAGIDKAAIVHSSTTYGYDNTYVADVVADYRHRFTGVFSVDVLAADAPATIRSWVRRGLAGLRLFTGGSTMDKQSGTLGDPRSFAAWECADDLGLPVCVQMRPEGLPQLMLLIKRFTGVTIIIDNLLRPPFEEGPPYAGSVHLFDLAGYGNVHLKLHTPNIRKSKLGKATPETFFAKLVGEFGAERIAWGSNFPATKGTLPAMVAEARAALASLSQDEQDWIFFRTAQKLYPALAQDGPVASYNPAASAPSFTN